MKKFEFIGIGLLLLFFGQLSFAQEDRDKTLLANDMFKAGDYTDALILYKKALDINPNNIEANFMAGKTLLQTTCCKNQAIDKFLKTYELDPTFNTKIFFHIGESYHQSYQFDKAIEFYNKYKLELEVNRRDYIGIDVNTEISNTERKIFECTNGKEFISKPLRIKIENLGALINSKYEDYGPAISSDNNEIYFTSKREGGFSSEKNVDNQFFEDIWHSSFVDGAWTAPLNLGPPVVDAGHNSAINLSPDGKKLYVYSSENNGDIYYSNKKNEGTWDEPKPIALLNTEFVESSLSITSDSKMMFFTSSKLGGMGGKDIYYCDLDADLNCIETPKNLGVNINSSFDEEAPFYDVKNNILYFASKGHKGMGGYDLFESSFNESNNTWSEPFNLGIPVNSTDDDVFMSLTADGKTGYYATYKEDSYGGNDIYKILSLDKIMEEEMAYVPEDTLSKEELSVVNSILPSDTLKENLSNTTNTLMPENVLETKPEVKNYLCKVEIKLVDAKGKIINGTTEVKLNNHSQIISNGKTTNGIYTFDFDYTKNEQLSISSEASGYFFQNTIHTISTSNNNGKVTIVVKLAPTKIMEIRPLKNIYFGFNKCTLTPSSFAEIDKLFNMLMASPKMHIEIAGHTDFIGGNSYNKELSQTRANAVRNALITKGIDAKRVKAIGYGEDHPLATNDDEAEGRELNRRTEFIIIPH